MKLAIARSTLLPALASVVRVVERKATIPILSNILLETRAKSLSMTCTDLDIQISTSAEATIGQAGALTAPAHLLHDIVRKAPADAELKFTADEPGKLVVAAGRSRFTLPTLPATDFPPLSAPAPDAVTFFLPAVALARLIDETSFAMSSEETRYYLCGIYLHAVDDPQDGTELRAVATDGHRLAMTQCALPPKAAGMPGVIIPKKTVAEIARLAQGAGDVEVTLTPSKIVVARAGTSLVSKLIDGTYPDYQRVIPKGNDKTVQVNREALRDAVDRVMAVADDKARAVKLAFSAGKLAVSVRGSESGSGLDEVDAQSELKLEIGFNGRYLLALLDVLGGETVTIRMDGAQSPTLFTGDNPDLTVVLMPLRV